MTQKKIKLGITTFGELSFVHESEVFKLDGYLTKNVRYLLEVLVYYRLTPLSKNQIIDLLWSGSNNPESALKFTIHRLRQALKDIPVFEHEPLIITTKQGYDLNPNFDFDVDFEEVDILWQLVNQHNKSDRERKKNLITLVNKISKPFLTGSSSLLWTIPIREYYNNIFTKSIMMLLELSEKTDKYQDMIQYAQKGISYDRLNEEFHYFHILGLIYDKQIRGAIEAFENTRELFFKELNADISEKTKKLFKLILSKDEMNIVKMSDLIMNLNENSPLDGAFYCEYEVFKRIYQNQLRAQERSGEESCLVILELRSSKNDHDIGKVMEKLKRSIDNGLRRSDVYSRLNSLQFVLLLPCKTRENGHVIIERVQKHFYKNISKQDFKLHYHMSVIVSGDSFIG